MTMCNPNDDGYADLADYDNYIDGVPHRTFTRLRDENPLSWSDFVGGKGFWNIVRHADILRLNRNFKLLSSAQGIRIDDQSQEEYLARRTFQELDPPDHTKMRIRVASAFSKPAMARFEMQVHALCERILDTAFLRTEFDAVNDIARALPMYVLGKILGVPECDLDWLVSKGDALIANTDPDYTQHVVDKTDTEAYRLMPFRSPAGAELYTYARALINNKIDRGEDTGVLGILLEADADGKVISETELRNFFCLLVAAGNDTIRYTLASSLHLLANQPHLLDQMQKADATAWKTIPDEMIRWASPTFHFRRTATADFEMHGSQIKKGDKVVLWFVSGNRDAAVFERPFEIDLWRLHNPHLAFGQGGPHVCLGMWLARLQVRVLLQIFVQRVAKIEQTGKSAYLRSNFVGGIKKLPVRITLR